MSRARLAEQQARKSRFVTAGITIERVPFKVHLPNLVTIRVVLNAIYENGSS
jgi:hypothetical protein